MKKKIGRNELCPCGSGRKYKKCCINKIPAIDGRFIHNLVDGAIDWILEDEYLVEEFDEMLFENEAYCMPNEMEYLIWANAFAFDHILEDGGTPFEYFLDNAEIPPDIRDEFERVKESEFGVFEVMNVYKGRGLELKDIFSETTVFVSEKMGSREIQPNMVIFCRLIPFNDTYLVITPAIRPFSGESAYMIKRHMKRFQQLWLEKKITSLDLMRVLLGGPPPEKGIDEIKKSFKRKLVSLGINSDFRGLGGRINQHADPMKAFPEIFDFNYPSNEDYLETMSLLKRLWNEHPRKEFDGRSPKEMDLNGPMEEMLKIDLIQESTRKIHPKDYPDLEAAQAAADEFSEKWLDEPQEDLGGKTPREVILLERKELGNPRTKVNINTVFTPLPDYDQNKAESLFNEAIDMFKRGAIWRAAGLYEETLEINPDNHVVWSNLGGCYAYMGEKGKAIECCKRALELEPGDEKGKQNLAYAMETDEKEMAMMGMLGVSRAMMHRFKKKRKDEEVDVWEEIREEMEKRDKKSVNE